MDWKMFVAYWLLWLFGYACGLFWAGRRRAHMDYQTALNIVWEHHCPDKHEPEVPA